MDTEKPLADFNGGLAKEDSSVIQRVGSAERSKSRTKRKREPRPEPSEAREIKLVVQVARGRAERPENFGAAEATSSSSLVISPSPAPPATNETSPVPEALAQKVFPEVGRQLIQARMLNEFVYCERLFYYEFVEGVFLESADTLRGHAIHQRVDSGNGALPSAKVKRGDAGKGATAASEKSESGKVSSDSGGKETIHSRSVQMGSERLGVIAKMDLVEVRASVTPPNGQGMGIQQELFPQVVVCPVDYKAGAPREGDDGNELWDTDKIQLGLQALILRENGYACHQGIIYYRATKQRVHLAITPELEAWVLEKIEGARRVAQGPIPSPLVDSPKCNRAPSPRFACRMKH